MLIRDIMTTRPLTARPWSTVGAVAETLLREDTRLPVAGVVIVSDREVRQFVQDTLFSDTAAARREATLAQVLRGGQSMVRISFIASVLLALVACEQVPVDLTSTGPGGDEGKGEEGEEGEGDVSVSEGEGKGEGKGEYVGCSDGAQTAGNPCAAGLGACRRSGVLSCADVETMVCSATGAQPTTTQDTSANGLDDDCDGVVDEDTCLLNPDRGAGCSAGLGECRSEGTRECVNNALVCSALAIARTTLTDATDDDIDNDCDGLVDEDVLPCTQLPEFGEVCSEGLGICRHEGNWGCSADGATVTCPVVAETPVATVDDTVNGLDDDCDGFTDEDALHPDRTPCDPLLTCCFANVYSQPREDLFHVDVPPDPPPTWRPDCNDPRNQLHWINNPPSSGPHLGCSWGRWDQMYDETAPLARGYQVHNMEHGGVLFLWNAAATDAAKTELFAAFASLSIEVRCGHTHSVATFDPELPTGVAIVALDRVLLPDATGIIPRAAAVQFAEACRDHGTELACGSGPSH